MTSTAVQSVILDLGQALKAARLARGETRATAAERVGVHEDTIARIEAGDTRVSLGTVFELADSMALTPHLQALAASLLNDEQTRRGLLRLSKRPGSRGAVHKAAGPQRASPPWGGGRPPRDLGASDTPADATDDAGEDEGWDEQPVWRPDRW